MAIRPGKHPQLANADWLRDQYGTQGKSCPQIAAEVGCTPGAVERRLHQFGIPVRGRHYGHWNDKECVRCGKVYTPSGPAAMFCSKQCQYGTLTCEQCGNEFPALPDQVKKNVTYKRRFCSQECRRAWWDENSKLRWVNQNGYVVMPDPSMKRRVNVNGYVDIQIGDREGSNNGRVLEHRWVMELRLGRRLLKSEDVHHRNGQRDDNDRCPNCPSSTPPPVVRKNRLHCAACGWVSTTPPNLELWSKSQPRGQRVEDKIEWALAFLAEYGRVSFQSALPTEVAG